MGVVKNICECFEYMKGLLRSLITIYRASRQTWRVRAIFIENIAGPALQIIGAA
jgi:hypothetical protein